MRGVALLLLFALALMGNVTIDPKAQERIGVKTVLVQKGPLLRPLRFAGRVAFDPDLFAAQSDYALARRQNEKLKQSPFTEARKSAAEMLAAAKLRLQTMGVAEGTPDPSLLAANAQQMWVYADVYESDLPLVHAGLEAEISGDALGGEALKTKVASVDKIIDPMTRTAKARILIQKPPARLLPQSFVDVTIFASLGEQIYIPFEALLNTGTKAIVYVQGDNAHFESREVKVAAYAGDKVAIAAGLKEGERVVVDAVFMIDSESRLRGNQATAKPVCPENEEWDLGMSMCMPKVSK